MELTGFAHWGRWQVPRRRAAVFRLSAFAYWLPQRIIGSIILAPFMERHRLQVTGRDTGSRSGSGFNRSRRCFRSGRNRSRSGGELGLLFFYELTIVRRIEVEKGSAGSKMLNEKL